MGIVDGKSALVTGAGAGIGRATALRFAAEGANVIVSDINAEDGEETVRLIKAAGGDASFVRADVSSADDVDRLVRKVISTYGTLDCACNNAGIEGYCPVCGSNGGGLRSGFICKSKRRIPLSPR